MDRLPQIYVRLMETIPIQDIHVLAIGMPIRIVQEHVCRVVILFVITAMDQIRLNVISVVLLGLQQLTPMGYVKPTQDVLLIARNAMEPPAISVLQATI